MSKLAYNYDFLDKGTPEKGRTACRSHEDIGIEHLFGNPNFTFYQSPTDPLIISFTCIRCGQTITYKRKTQYYET